MRPYDKHLALQLTTTILSGATDSSQINIEGYPLISFIFGTMTGTTMTFKAAEKDGGTFVVVKDNTGSNVSITIASNTAVSLTPTILAQLAPYQFIKLVSGSAEGSDRTITVCLKG